MQGWATRKGLPQIVDYSAVPEENRRFGGTRPESPRATFCSRRCRMVAFRRRHVHQQRIRDLSAHSLTKPRRDHLVYECAECETRYLGEQRCPECNRFCRRLGLGGHCPGCGDVVTVDELIKF